MLKTQTIALALTSIAAFSIINACNGSSGGGGSAAAGGAPAGDPTAAYGELQSEDAKSFVTAQLAISENISMMGLSQENASSIKASVTAAPSAGVPAGEATALRDSYTLRNVTGCSSAITGTAVDADGDGLAVDLTNTYDCSIDNSATADFWSWKTKGSWNVKDRDDTVANNGVRYEVLGNEYSGKYKNRDGVEQSYSGKTEGYSDWKKDGTTATSEVRYASEFQFNTNPLVKTIYLNKMTFVEDAASSSSNRKGVMQLSGFVRSEKDGKTFILAQEGKDLVVDLQACNYSGFKSGTMTFIDAKAHKLVVTYDNCVRKITLDEQELPAVDLDKEASDPTMLSCKSLSAEGGDNAAAGADLVMYKCENISINASGVVGTTDEEKMTYLKDACTSGRGQGATYRTVASAGRICPTPEKGLGYSCSNTKVTFNGTVNVSLMGNSYNYLTATSEGNASYYKDNCEFPYVGQVKSTTQVGTFVEY